MSKKKKIIYIILTIVLIISVIAGTSIAFFGWVSEDEATVDVTVAGGNGECTLYTDNNIFIEPSSNRNGGRIIKLKGKQLLSSKASITWNMNIKSIDVGLQDASFKYEMINNSTGTSYGSGSFEGVTSGSSITFSNTNEIIGMNLEYEFTLYLWIDGNMGDYQLSMAG